MDKNDPLTKALFDFIDVALDKVEDEAEERVRRLLRAQLLENDDEILHVGQDALKTPTSAAITVGVLISVTCDLWRLQYKAHNPDASAMELVASLEVALQARRTERGQRTEKAKS
jgi:hypothetical protein